MASIMTPIKNNTKQHFQFKFKFIIFNKLKYRSFEYTKPSLQHIGTSHSTFSFEHSKSYIDITQVCHIISSWMHATKWLYSHGKVGSLLWESKSPRPYFRQSWSWKTKEKQNNKTTRFKVSAVKLLHKLSFFIHKPLGFTPRVLRECKQRQFSHLVVRDLSKKNIRRNWHCVAP